MGNEVTEEEAVAICKAARSGKETAQQAADRLGRPVGTVRAVARRRGFPFRVRGNTAGPREPYSEERKAAMRAGAIAAHRRRAGLEA